LIKNGEQDIIILAGLDFNVNKNTIGGMEAFGAVCTREEF
jgi:3-oxoacyl-(acyl-carrier-protein) synthase